MLHSPLPTPGPSGDSIRVASEDRQGHGDPVARRLYNTIQNSADYIQGWAKVLRKDKRLVVTAASQGQRAADYILASPAGREGLAQ